VPQPAFLFDLDGTLVDSVYQHGDRLARSPAECGVPLSVWRIHRRIGMSGGLFLNALQRETGHELDTETLERLFSLHAEHYLRRIGGPWCRFPARPSSSAICKTTKCRLPSNERVTA